MRVVTVNVNGIRAAMRKGFFEWLALQKADVVCLQEVRAQNDQLSDSIYHPQGYHCVYVPAEKKGYSGVAIYSREQPIKVTEGLGFSLADEEGRYVEIELARCHVASLYLPSGSHKEERQALKYHFLDQLQKKLEAVAQGAKPMIMAGDWNMAHRQIDIKNWRANQKNSGFLPQERAWLDHLFDHIGMVDAFRQYNQEPDQYTWWSNRGRAWQNNVGWRIDYQVVSPALRDQIKGCSIYKEQRFSDHAPLLIDYQL